VGGVGGSRAQAENPTGLHRRRFTLPTEWDGRRVTLTIGSAESVVYVWVNGAPVGMGKDSRLPSEFEITPHLVAGENTIALAVVQWSDATWLEDQDQWWLPGLHRSVSLTCTAPTWIADLALRPSLGSDGAATLDASCASGSRGARSGLEGRVRAV
jgi:beta-galactosidase